MQIGKTLGLAALALFVVVTSAQPYGADHKHRGQCPIYTKASKNCDLSQAVLPMTGSTELLRPASNLTLVHVAVGQGVQLYTCASSEDKDVPVTNGARAELYNATCLSTKCPSALNRIPGKFLEADKNRVLKELKEYAGSDTRIAKHYFQPNTTPIFEFYKSDERFYGIRAQAVPAPSSAPKGKYGATPWLRLTSVEGSNGITEVYRVETAGGGPPKTCLGRQPSFEIKYSAEYWFYK